MGISAKIKKPVAQQLNWQATGLSGQTKKKSLCRSFLRPFLVVALLDKNVCIYFSFTVLLALYKLTIKIRNQKKLPNFATEPSRETKNEQTKKLIIAM